MRVLLTHSYFLKFDPKQWRQMQPYAPLGTLYAAALLRENGYQIALHDVMFAEGPSSIGQALAEFQPQVLVIYDDGFNYLTKMCLTNMRQAAFELARLGKEFGCKVIVSSSDATDHLSDYLDNHADFIVVGEGEVTLLELLSAINTGRNDFDEIAGISFSTTDGKLVRTKPRTVIHDLDTLPDPAWDLADIEMYRQAWIARNGYFSINMSTTRGCPFKCNWCAKPIYGNRYNVRSPERVVSELLSLKKQFGFDHVWFTDDIFGLKPGWIQRFAELVELNDLHFSFKIQSRADLLLNDAQIGPLAQSGCQTVWIGAESGSQKILDAMDKGITTTQILDASLMLKKHGIRVAWFLQFGYQGETMEDIGMTLKMLHNGLPDDIGISVSYPLPGTKFYELVQSQLKAKANWTDSDDLALMFRNTYTAAFYRRLHKYVHAYYRRLKAKAGKKNSLKAIIKVPYYTIQQGWHKRFLNNETHD